MPMLALIVMYVGFKYFDANIGGLFSVEMADAPWGWAKFVDMLKHLPVVAIVLGIGGTAAIAAEEERAAARHGLSYEAQRLLELGLQFLGNPRGEGGEITQRLRERTGCHRRSG